MRRLTRLFSLLLTALAVAQVAAPGRAGGVQTGDPAAAAVVHDHGTPGSGHQACHHPASPERAPCEGHAPHCPSMVGCFTVGPIAQMLLVSDNPPDAELPFLPRDVRGAQFAPVPESPPPRA